MKQLTCNLEDIKEIQVDGANPYNRRMRERYNYTTSITAVLTNRAKSLRMGDINALKEGDFSGLIN